MLYDSRPFRLCLLAALFIFTEAHPQSFSSPEKQEILQIADGLSPLESSGESRGIESAYFSALTGLRREIVGLRDRILESESAPRPGDWASPLDSMGLLRARAQLYEAMQTDFRALRSTGRLDDFGLITYAQKEEWIGKALQLRFELAHLLEVRLSLLRTDYRSFIKTFDEENFVYLEIFDSFYYRERLSDRGIREMSQGSARAQALADALSQSLQSDLSKLFKDSLAFTTQVSELSNSAISDTITSEFDRLENLCKSLSSRILWLNKKYRQSLPALDSISKIRFASLQDVEDLVAELGRELQVALQVASATLEKIEEKGGRAFWQPIYDFPGIRILKQNPFRELGMMLGYSSSGGQEFSELTLQDLPGEARSSQALRLYQEALLLQYLTAAGIAISRLGKTREGRESLRERLQIFTGRWLGWGDDSNQGNGSTDRILQFPQTAGGSGSSELATSNGKTSHLEGRPARRHQVLEDQLWRVFFDNAKIAENCEGPLMKSSIKRISINN